MAVCWQGRGQYPERLPFFPPHSYPELGPFGASQDPTNGVYSGVRQLLLGLGYDRARQGTPEWSPLSDLVQPGGCVVLKPNFVRHYNEDPQGDLMAVVTHLSVLRPLIDYACLAVGREGSVVVADAPQYDCEVERLLARNGLPELLDWYRHEMGFEVEWRDLRIEFGRHVHGVQTEKRRLAGDPEGYQVVDLGEASELAGLPERSARLLRGADYDEQVTIRHHSSGRHEYLVSRTVLDADLVINCPKVKTHKKTGVTLSTKNLIGINGDKNWLPHYRAGFVPGGGDEFPRADAYARVRRAGAGLARRMLKRGLGGGLLRRLRGLEEASGLGVRTRNGNWYGNDTIWRTCIDLNKVFYLADRGGRLAGSPGRRALNVHDGIVAGQGNGPMGPTSRHAGLLCASPDGIFSDIVVAWLMGFDWRKLSVLSGAVGELRGGMRLSSFSLDDASNAGIVRWIDAHGTRDLTFPELEENFHFEPHPAWKGQIERGTREVASCAS